MTKKPDPPKCPYCGEDKLVEIEGFKIFCNVCGKASALPMPPKNP